MARFFDFQGFFEGQFKLHMQFPAHKPHENGATVYADQAPQTLVIDMYQPIMMDQVTYILDGQPMTGTVLQTGLCDDTRVYLAIDDIVKLGVAMELRLLQEQLGPR